MTDLYNSMIELQYKENDWSIEMNTNKSNILSFAPHGGGIEAGSSELALLISQKLDCNYFTFKGKLPTNNSKLHVTSTRYDNPELLNLMREVDYSISIHGYADNEYARTLIGGSDEKLKEIIKCHLRSHGFDVQNAPNHLAGSKPNNITNKTKKGLGVQLELSTKQRKSFFSNEDFSRKIREDRYRWRAVMYEYAQAIEYAVKEYLN
ncbi:poly-gamma-glutamate hydrolase family protein [Staphylococcus hominis]|uniref:poly-gamma-glutamate hydrolase family protein n=1 Tax=Staphylococcus hominis TaxID=1290 RepID=UPI00158DCF41|nr:poly-gamma-glutamate hydrolase family protein [Staphylococcus hominis]QKW67560.1 poly-gamma-glutamate hydrolase family protein [Staphylococcus hominis]